MKLELSFWLQLKLNDGSDIAFKLTRLRLFHCVSEECQHARRSECQALPLVLATASLGGSLAAESIFLQNPDCRSNGVAGLSIPLAAITEGYDRLPNLQDVRSNPAWVTNR